MTFGEVLRKIRKKEGLTIQELGKEAGVFWTTIAAVETNKKPASKPFVSSIIDYFGKYKHELAEAYLLEYMPVEVLKNAKDHKNFVLSQFNRLMEGLNDESRIELYKIILDHMAVEHLRNGTYELAKEGIEETKKMIEEKENATDDSEKTTKE